MHVKLAKLLIECKTKSISNRGAFSNFSKTESIIFSKFLHEIKAAAVCFVIEHECRKSQQYSRIRVRAQRKLVYPVRNLSDSSKLQNDQQIKGI